VKGQLVCELDSAALRDELVNQEIATQRARADRDRGRLSREVAEIAVTEYRDGTSPEQVQEAESQAKLAESALLRDRERLEWSDRMLAIGYVSRAQNQSDRLALEQSEYAQRAAATRLDVLRRYTGVRTLKELQAEVEKSRTD